MPESFIQLPPNSTGLKAHSFQRVIGANTVEDEVVLQGEHYLTTCSVVFSTSVATANDHLIQIMATAAVILRIREIYLAQDTAVTTAGRDSFQVMRLTTAGTGGGVVTPSKFDNADTSVATAMTLPTVKGAEGAILLNFMLPMAQTAPFPNSFYQWQQTAFEKPIIVPTGTANGIAIKSLGANAAGIVRGYVVFDEATF